MQHLQVRARDGLSPRVRGNRRVRQGVGVERGSIPASAGEPSANGASLGWLPVYPRECGGTSNVRGALTRRPGSIPASAGEPPCAASCRAPCRVYPRECGGTWRGRRAAPTVSGLSPRVRGNQPAAVAMSVTFGSIPASAGEPAKGNLIADANMVYPRECGGTTVTGERTATKAGLSPRVRGNPRLITRPQSRTGSIPASAGEPASAGSPSAARRVYPRECGGTHAASICPTGGAGLSPRVRGNPRAEGRRGPPGGSIPASAGEPCCRPRSGRCRGVYPRECGGTRGTPPTLQPAHGLSPRVRGNPYRSFAQDVLPRSIPASAGEPG